MNGRLIPDDQKLENRRARDRRRYQWKLRRRRERLLSPLQKQPAALALLASDLVDDADIMGLLTGRIDEVRYSVRKLQVTLALADLDGSPDPEAEGSRRALESPARVLQKSRRGKLPSATAFRERFFEGQRYARALERVGLIPALQGAPAHFDCSTLSELFPGLDIPTNLCRQNYLLKFTRCNGSAEAIEVFSARGLPLILIPLESGSLAYDVPNAAAAEADFRSPGGGT